MLAGLLSPLLARAKPASADPIANKRAEAARLAAQIDAQGMRVNALSEAYDAARIKVSAVDAQLASARAALRATQAQVATLEGRLSQDAVTAYVNQGSGMGGLAALLQGSEASFGVEQQYLATLAGREQSTVDALHVARRAEAAHQGALQAAQGQDRAALAGVAGDRQAAIDASNALRSTLSQVKGQLATLVAQAQAAAAAAQERVVKARLAAQAAASRQAAAASAAGAQGVPALQGILGGGGGGVTSNGPVAGGVAPAPPPGNGGAGAAVAAAEAELGKPYVWGAAGPDAFDCSGLVMWAWDHAGVSLPHNAAAQWAATARVPVSQLQPGDLVFFDNLGHVGLYIGGGQMVVADHTGVPVRYASIYRSGLMGGGRVY